MPSYHNFKILSDLRDSIDRRADGPTDTPTCYEHANERAEGRADGPTDTPTYHEDATTRRRLKRKKNRSVYQQTAGFHLPIYVNQFRDRALIRSTSAIAHWPFASAVLRLGGPPPRRPSASATLRLGGPSRPLASLGGSCPLVTGGPAAPR